MNYETLTKVFYKYGKEVHNFEIIKRKTGYGSYTTGLNIRGFKKGTVTSDVFELFYVNTHELMTLNNQVLLNSSKISYLVSKLPKVVIQPYFEKLIVNEAQSNNEIEGIRSTKKELKEALNASKLSESKNKKFIGLMKTYSHIDKIEPFSNIEDFRKLYDDLVSDEIKDDDKPDGKFFRKGYVEVNDGVSTTHVGVLTEEKIIEYLVNLINFLDNEDHPELYRYMVSHYFYEYIHPFYDGNGRTGRLIVGSYLSRYLERYSAITFSYAVNKDKNKYYKSLEEIPTTLNQGDMTFYLINMLSLLIKGQNGIIEDLELNLMKLERIYAYFKTDYWKEKKSEASDFMKTMVMINVFVDNQVSFSIQELMKSSKLSRHVIDKAMKELEDEGYIEKISRNPKVYKVCENFIENILPN
ncbi:Fic family protein [Lysinibacillus sp. FSL H8-0500]|uniref:Fic family protein n=1 Tax=Lysinibacillus sp. FSL H8-0500 TaxID=2921393 RepID=UPI003100D768